jgi:hypothetical protein
MGIVTNIDIATTTFRGEPRPPCRLVGMDGNAYSIIRRWRPRVDHRVSGHRGFRRGEQLRQMTQLRTGTRARTTTTTMSDPEPGRSIAIVTLVVTAIVWCIGLVLIAIR